MTRGKRLKISILNYHEASVFFLPENDIIHLEYVNYVFLVRVFFSHFAVYTVTNGVTKQSRTNLCNFSYFHPGERDMSNHNRCPLVILVININFSRGIPRNNLKMINCTNLSRVKNLCIYLKIVSLYSRSLELIYTRISRVHARANPRCEIKPSG